MNIKDVHIFFEDGHYTADISLDSWYIVTEWKTFDELLRMIDDAIKWYAESQSTKEYSLSRAMPVFTFNFGRNATHVQTH